MRGGEGQFEDQVVVERLWVEDSVVGEDGVVQVDAILSPIYCIQRVFLSHAAGLLIASIRADPVQIHTLNALAKAMFSRLSLERKRSSKVL